MDGIVIPQDDVEVPVWAERRDLDNRDVEEVGGTGTEVRRDYRIRWRSDIAGTPVARLAFTSEDALAFDAERLIEETNTGRRNDSGTRRQWLRLQGVHSP